MITDKNSNKVWFISAAITKKGDGSDFYFDILSFCEDFGFNTFNTMYFGKLGQVFLEFFLLFRVPTGATIVTSWPGFPWQFLALPHFINNFRFKLFIWFKRKRKWRYCILPIDRPLEQFENRLTNYRQQKEKKEERCLFLDVDTFLCCGEWMQKHYSSHFSEARCVKFDLYDQKLPECSNSSCFVSPSTPIRIVISGNLSRMIQCIDILPQWSPLSYYFTGPEGNWVTESGRDDFKYLGVLDELSLIRTLAGFHYGLIVYSKDKSEYFSTVMAGKLSTYLACSLPVICLTEYKTMSNFISEKELGMAIKDISLLKTVPVPDSPVYKEWFNNVVFEGNRVRIGDHYREAFKAANII